MTSTYNPENYYHGETVLVPTHSGVERLQPRSSGDGYDRVVIDEVLDDQVAARYEGGNMVFVFPYDDVVRPAKSVEELID